MSGSLQLRFWAMGVNTTAKVKPNAAFMSITMLSIWPR